MICCCCAGLGCVFIALEESLWNLFFIAGYYSVVRADLSVWCSVDGCVEAGLVFKFAALKAYRLVMIIDYLIETDRMFIMGN